MVHHCSLVDSGGADLDVALAADDGDGVLLEDSVQMHAPDKTKNGIK